MNYILFGGSGFIGTHLIHLLNKEAMQAGDKIYDCDIVMPGEEGVVPGIVEQNENVEYVRSDVRNPVELNFNPTPDDIIINLAAVHRTPGHRDEEYFETNIRGAENVTAFAEQHGIRKILFTSSIAPYGADEALKEESTLPTPNTPYGISKLVAEKIHEKWQEKPAERINDPETGSCIRKRGAWELHQALLGDKEKVFLLHRKERYDKGEYICKRIGGIHQILHNGAS